MFATAKSYYTYGIVSIVSKRRGELVVNLDMTVEFYYRKIILKYQTVMG